MPRNGDTFIYSLAPPEAEMTAPSSVYVAWMPMMAPSALCTALRLSRWQLRLPPVSMPSRYMSRRDVYMASVIDDRYGIWLPEAASASRPQSVRISSATDAVPVSIVAPCDLGSSGTRSSIPSCPFSISACAPAMDGGTKPSGALRTVPSR